MYSRRIDGGETPTFGVSGKLWHGVLVMRDRESGSLWSQLDGRAIVGPLRGEKLRHVPSVQTTWAEWKAAHPDTLVLKKSGEERSQNGSRYADYFSDPDRLMMPRLKEGLGGVGPKDLVHAVVLDGEAFAVSDRLLEREGSLTVFVAGRAVRFERDPDSGGVVARDPAGHLLPSFTAYWYAWKRIHPRSRVLSD